MPLSVERMAGALKPKKQHQRAVQYDSRDHKLYVNEIPIPSPKPNELLVKVACASLCHSDVMRFEPDNPVPLDSLEPVTIGHEATGYVVEAGSETKGFDSGDQVGFLPAIDCCFDCYSCKNVHNFWCQTGKSSMQGFNRNGYFQEFVTVDFRSAIVLPEGLDASDSSPVFCAGVTAYHGIDDCHLEPGQWVAIIGCGGLGHLGVQYAKAMGLSVVGIDISDSQLEEARAQGADHVFNPQADKTYVQKVMDITKGGADAVVNYTASKQSYDGCPSIVRSGTGVIMVVGIPHQPIQFSAMDIAMGRYRVQGSNNGTGHNLRPAIEFTAKHKIRAHLTTYRLEQVPEMVDLMLAGKARGRLGVKFE